MGVQGSMGGDGRLMVGEDKTIRLEVLDDDDVPVDMTTWTVKLVALSKKGDELINKTATISGSYNATRSLNAQRAVVTLTDTELSIAAGTHEHSWKRTDDGSEAVLHFGECIIEQTTQV